MLTESQLGELFTAGHGKTDDEFAAHARENLLRTAYLMAHFLSRPEYPRLDSTELTALIKKYLAGKGIEVAGAFNPIAWFSAEWTAAKNGHPQHFLNEYFDIFVREETTPAIYSIEPSLRAAVAKTLLDLGSPELSAATHELAQEGAFAPVTAADARRWDLRAVVVRQGQPLFRAALLRAYGGRCAITGCDAAPALEAAHIRPYSGVASSDVTNGLLLRADIHTLFDLDLIGIEPMTRLVRVSSRLQSTVYWKLDGETMNVPHDVEAYPEPTALEMRWKAFNDATK